MTLNATETTAKPASLTPRPTVPAPTPWRWSASGKPTGKSLARFHIYVEDKDGRKIAAVWGKDGEREATADLMVAAPALASALRAMLQQYGKPMHEEWINENGFEAAKVVHRQAQAALAMLDDAQR